MAAALMRVIADAMRAAMCMMQTPHDVVRKASEPATVVAGDVMMQQLRAVSANTLITQMMCVVALWRRRRLLRMVLTSATAMVCDMACS